MTRERQASSQEAPVAVRVRLTVLRVGDFEVAISGRVARTLPLGSPLPRDLAHGDARLPVVDLRVVLGVEEKEPVEDQDEEQRKEQERGDRLGVVVVQAGCSRALVADDLVGTELWELLAPQPLPALYSARERQPFAGLLPRPDGRVLALLDLERIAPRQPSEGGAARLVGE